MSQKAQTVLVKYKDWKTIALGIAAVAAAATMSLVENITVLLVPFGAVFSLIILQYPVIGLWFIAVWNDFQHLFTVELAILPRLGTWLDEGVLSLLFIRMSILVLKRGKFLKSPVDKSFALLLGVGLLSAIFNKVPLNFTILGLRSFVQYVIFYYVIVNSGFSKRELRITSVIIFSLAFLQVPVTYYQYMEFRNSFEPDRVFGTLALGWGNLLGLYLSAFVCLFGGIYYTTRRKLYLLGAILLATAMPLTSSRAALYFLPISLFFMFGKWILSRPKVLLVILTFLLITAGIVAIYYSSKPGGLSAGIQQLKPSQLLAEQLGNKYSPGRLYYFMVGWDILRTEAASPLIGVGPGMFSSSAGGYLHAPLLERVTSEAYSPSIPGQYIATGVEYGVLGLLLSIAMYLALILRNETFIRGMADPFWRGIALGMRGVLILTLIGAFAENLWEVQPYAYIPWFFSGALLLIYVRQKSTNSASR